MEHSSSYVATIKLVSGDELLAKVIETQEQGSKFLYLEDPIIFRENYTQLPDGRMGVGLHPCKFLEFSTSDEVLVPIQHVMAMSELDRRGIDFYHKSVLIAKSHATIKKHSKTTDNMAYVGDVNKIKETLEQLFDETS